jgi:hypothetical protein
MKLQTGARFRARHSAGSFSDAFSGRVEAASMMSMIGVEAALAQACCVRWVRRDRASSHLSLQK